MFCKSLVLAGLVSTILSASTLKPRQLIFSPSYPKGDPFEVTKPPQTLPNEVENCNRWHEIRPGTACFTIVELYADDGLTLDELYGWNPDIDATCSNLVPGDNICIGIEDMSPSPPVPTLGPPQPPEDDPVVWPSPVMPGVTDDCVLFEEVEEGKACIDITQKYDIDLNDFLSWNSKVNRECTNMWADYYVCVGV